MTWGKWKCRRIIARTERTGSPSQRASERRGAGKGKEKEGVTLVWAKTVVGSGPQAGRPGVRAWL